MRRARAVVRTQLPLATHPGRVVAMVPGDPTPKNTRPMSDNSAQKQVNEAISVGWVEGGSFFGSILSGTLLGYFADQWLGTDPWLVITGILLGTYSGSLRVWHYSKRMLER